MKTKTWMRHASFCLLVSYAGVIHVLSAADWPQFRGPSRDGISPETGLLKTWPEGGPAHLWSVDGIGGGFSSASVTGNRIYVTGRKDTLDWLSALELDGTLLWQIPYGRSCRRTFPDSRCTPTVDEDRVYVISGGGEVVCVDAKTGRIQWSVPAHEKFHGRYWDWEIAESPLIVDDKIIYTPGGHQTTMVALDKRSGETVWQTKSLHDSVAYVSPRLIRHHRKDIIISVTCNYLFGVDARYGRILWHHDYAGLHNETSIAFWDGGPFTNTNTPLYRDGRIYITSGYDHVGAMFDLLQDGSEVRLKWIDETLDVHHGGVILKDGYIYGANWINNSRGNWCCIEWETGRTMYEHEWNKTKGSIIAADDMLYCYDEMRGNIALVRATPEKFDIVGTFQVKEGRGPHWAHPAIANGRLYVRHGDVLQSYDIKDPNR